MSGTCSICVICMRQTSLNIFIFFSRCSGFGPGTSNTEIEAYLLIPRFVIECYFDCYARAALVVPFHAKGDVTAVVSKYFEFELETEKTIFD